MKRDRNVYRYSNTVACHCTFRQLSDKKNHGFRAKNDTMWYIVRWKEVFSNFVPFYRQLLQGWWSSAFHRMGILRCCVSRCLNAKVVRAVLSWIFLDLLGHPMSSCSLSRCCSEVFCFNIRAFFLRYQWTDIEIFIINFDKISLYRSRILFSPRMARKCRSSRSKFICCRRSSQFMQLRQDEILSP